MRIFEYSWQTAAASASCPRAQHDLIFPGQQAASLATVLLEGLSHDRVVRSLVLLHNSAKLKSLPSDWYRDLGPGRTSAETRSLEGLSGKARSPRDRIAGPTLLPILELVSKGAPAAEQVGEELLSGQARAIWRRALLDGPPEALMTTDEAGPGPG